jgi:predicted transcriptional regulator
MAHKFEKLESKLDPKRVSKAKAKDIMAEIRKEAGITQQNLAASLGVKQPTLSKLESQEDMQISTLQRLIQALGGQLELIAHMPGGDIRISQFRA